MRIVLGRDPEVADWVARRIPHVGSGEAFGPCRAIGVQAQDGRPLGGVVFSNWQPACRSIEASFAADTPRWLTRRIIAAILAYPFVQLDCQRITTLTPRRARAARRFIDAFGFKREGLVRKGFGYDDAVVSGLLKREWEGGRWGLVRANSQNPKLSPSGHMLAPNLTVRRPNGSSRPLFDLTSDERRTADADRVIWRCRRQPTHGPPPRGLSVADLPGVDPAAAVSGGSAAGQPANADRAVTALSGFIRKPDVVGFPWSGSGRSGQ